MVSIDLHTLLHSLTKGLRLKLGQKKHATKKLETHNGETDETLQVRVIRGSAYGLNFGQEGIIWLVLH